MCMRWVTSVLLLLFLLVGSVRAGEGRGSSIVGYYRQPAIHGETIVFVSEGDLWKVSVKGGVATRLTSHPGEEGLPALSPDGKTLAFTGQYEGPTEVYSMPVRGGRPRRHTFGATRITYVGWTPTGKILYSTDRYSTLPNVQLVRIDPKGKGASTSVRIPLAQAASGSYDEHEKTLFFTRLPFQGSHTRRYRGGTVEQIWSFTSGEPEAKRLTGHFPGTSKRPLFYKGRIYFVSDKDGTMNVWSMKPDGSNWIQHTNHRGWDVASPSLHAGKIVYQVGADLHLLNLATGKDRRLLLTLDSDLDQTREHWVKEPMDYLSAAHLAPDGRRVVLTARGQVFVVPTRTGRLVEVKRKPGVRYRDAVFMPDGKQLAVLSDETGEVEVWLAPANGLGKAEQLTRNGEVLRWQALPSPDGKYIAHRNKNQRLFLYDVQARKDRKIDESRIDDFVGLAWSPDSRWLAYVARANNLFRQIKIYRVGGIQGPPQGQPCPLEVADGKSITLTTDRFDSYSPAWSPDGKWLYFLSDRNLRSVVPSPWGNYQPEPFLAKKTRIYHIPLLADLRSPFDPPNELAQERKIDEKKDKKDPRDGADKPVVKIDLKGIQRRLIRVPVSPGNYSHLAINDKALFFISSPTGSDTKNVKAVAIQREDVTVKTVVEGVKRYEMSRDGKKLLIHKGKKLYVIDANVGTASLTKKEVKLSSWNLSVIPREEWQQMFDEAWRLERDYFYDRGMHGVDWKAVRKKYRPLVKRVHNRAELSDLIARMVSELSALHIFVRNGDVRKGPDQVKLSSLGGILERVPAQGGYVVRHLYQSDPDEPSRASPLVRPGVKVGVGDVITTVNGRSTLSVAHLGALLRNKAGQQVLLQVKSGQGKEKVREVIVRPLSLKDAADLRYHEWEYTRRLRVEKAGKGELGYVHLRAMGGRNFTEWAKGYYPVFTRKGLIIDVRHNRGGNIDSWILSRVLRKAWFYWNQRVGQSPMWNMQYAFRGHIVVLCNERTASDGEAFCEGIKRLKLGKVIGTRTWGGEIWLTASNFLVDKGIATAAEYGVYGPEGAWLIEGHGVDPDIVVDNPPHATFKGKDAQLEAAIRYLQKKIKAEPVKPVLPPKFPTPAAKTKPTR